MIRRAKVRAPASLTGSARRAKLADCYTARALVPMTPQIFGRYTLIQRIGEGGMADVFLAEAGVAEGLKKRVESLS